MTGVKLLVILVALRCGFEPFKTLRSAPVWARAALVVLILIAFANAALVAIDPLASALRSSMALVHLLFALRVSHLVCVTHEWRGNAPLIAIVAGHGRLLGPARTVRRHDPGTWPFDWLHLGLGVMNIRHVGFFAAVGAAAALGLAAGATNIRSYLASLAAAAIMFGPAFWTGSRGPITGVLGGSVVALALIPAFRSRRAVIAVVASVPTGALLSLVHSVPNPHYGIVRLAGSASNVSVGAMSSGRVELWTGTWRAILQRPLFGYGEGQLAMVVPEAKGLFHHPHNAFLQVIFQ